ncbi:MAG: sigma-70 family RNA polymerase sigma factor [Nocardioidaceae bacterium]
MSGRGETIGEIDYVLGEPLDWPTALALPGAQQQEAMRRLHVLMVRAARHQVRRMEGMLPGLGVERYDELANAAADEAMTSLLDKLDTFEGRSRFTTWAYKFAILQASVEVRRHAWSTRQVSLDDVELRCDTSASPEEHAEAVDLAAAVTRAMGVALTPYQRRIAVALLVDSVPIDVLADRLGTTRGALYKTLHEVRRRLRAHLRASGHLPTATTPGDAR